jgi:hypothetical protein
MLHKVWLLGEGADKDDEDLVDKQTELFNSGDQQDYDKSSDALEILTYKQRQDRTGQRIVFFELKEETC